MEVIRHESYWLCYRKTPTSGPHIGEPVKILKGDKDFPAFKDANEFLNYARLSKMDKEHRQNHKLLSKISDSLKANDDDKLTLKEHLLNDDKPPVFPFPKGVIELSNLVGTVIGLAWIASELSNHILHPLMYALGFKSKPAVQQKDNAKTVEKMGNSEKLDMKV